MAENFSDKKDEELVIIYRDTGKMIYAGELFKRYSLMCFAISMKYLKNENEAQDAVMNIFEKSLRDIKKFDITNFKNWLHSVIRNHCLMQLRNRKSKLLNDSIDITDENNFMKNQIQLHQNDDTKDKEEKIVMLEEAILLLGIKQKTCIELFYLQNKSYEDISKITGFSSNEVKSFIQNGKRNLKNILIEKGIDLTILICLGMNV